mmetsp:Transcript_13308/g.28234  ORF Transcript_13308/g.28234 Transcript_13308/m.28234 type:complete len:305 (+) Transcript_13308:483-1397(+)
MKKRGLGSVFSPKVVEELSSIHVLTTKWVDGERLSDSDAEDVPRLCGVALNAYLTMLLDTGTLHCDPHPGNLLRTPDGRLCILDWGMVIDVPEDLQLSLLEFIADLNANNYEDVPDDLVKLQFVPENKIEELRQSGLTVAIANMLSLAAEGGGPKGAMQRMVAQNKERYAEALAEFDDLDSKEATEVRQRLFREDWNRQMAEDALSRGDKDSLGTTFTTVDVTMKIEQMQEQNAVLLCEESNSVQNLLLHVSAAALDVAVRNALLSPLEPIRDLPLPKPRREQRIRKWLYWFSGRFRAISSGSN